MKIVLFGATGQIGRRIAKEALDRGHSVTAVQRAGGKPLDLVHPGLARAEGDVLDAASVARAASGHDVAVSAYGPPQDRPELVVDAARALVEGARAAGVSRLLVVGGAGGLEVAPGLQLVDAPSFPAEYKPIALAHRDAFEVVKKAEVDWTFFAPPALIQPGERTGRFRLGRDQLLADEKGQSAISMEDYAVAMVDEIEKGAHRRMRFTAAY